MSDITNTQVRVTIKFVKYFKKIFKNLGRNFFVNKKYQIIKLS